MAVSLLRCGECGGDAAAHRREEHGADLSIGDEGVVVEQEVDERRARFLGRFAVVGHAAGDEPVRAVVRFDQKNVLVLIGDEGAGGGEPGAVELWPAPGQCCVIGDWLSSSLARSASDLTVRWL